MKDLLGWAGLLGLALAIWWKAPSLQLSSGVFLLLAAALLVDLAVLLAASSGASRVAPIVCLTALLVEPSAAVWANLALLLGSLLLVLPAKQHRHLLGDLVRTQLPFCGGAILWLLYPEGHLGQLLALQCFVLLSLLVEPRRPLLRMTLLNLLCAPGLAVGGLYLMQAQPLFLPLLLPALAALSLGRDESFPLLMRMRRALSMSQRRLAEQSRQVSRLSALLKAAQLMAASLDAAKLEAALATALKRCGLEGVTVGEAEGSDGRLSLPPDLTDEQRDLVAILSRIFQTCRENVALHQQVVVALEETRRSQAAMLDSSRLAAVGRLAAGVAHEVNTPLGAIHLAAEFGERLLDSDIERVREQLGLIRRSSENAQKSVERLLQYSQPERADEGSFSARATVEDALELLVFRIERAQVKVERLLEGDAQMQGSQHDFYTLASNLLLNAIDACAGVESPTVGVRLTRQSDGSLLLEVEDNGPGIEPGIANQIFEPFFTTKPSGEGNGLGLYLARRAVESFGGALRHKRGQLGGALFQARFSPSDPG